nr:hypothetical protein [Tanacetum cinerariifolium]
MSDFKHSLVTCTSVPNTVDDYLDIGSPEVDGPPSPNYVPGPKEPEQAPLSPDYVHGPKELEQAPLSPDCVLGPEEPEQAPPLPVNLPYVQELVYPEYMPPEDDVFPAEEQPLPIVAITTTDSPRYIPEFDPNEDPEEDDEEDPEEDPADYPVDSTVVALPAIDHVPSEEVTKPLPQIPSPPLPIPSPPPDSPTHIEIPERVNQRVTDLSTIVEQETTIMYGMMEEAQDDRSQLGGRVNLLYRDRPVHHNLAVMIERERLGWLMRLGDYPSDCRRQGVIKELLAADHKRQVQLTKALRR